MTISQFFVQLLNNLSTLAVGNVLMIGFGVCLIALGLVRKTQPALFLGVGLGCVFANLGLSNAGGMMKGLYDAGVGSSLLPILALVCLGTAIDFRPIVNHPQRIFIGMCAQIGIYAGFVAAALLKLPLAEAGSVASTAAFNGPMAVYIAAHLAPQLVAPVLLADLFGLVLMGWLAPHLRRTPVPQEPQNTLAPVQERPVSRALIIALPILLAVLLGIIAPDGIEMAAAFLVGNLLCSTGIVPEGSLALRKQIGAFIFLVFGLAAGSSMYAGNFFNPVVLRAFGISLAGCVISFGVYWLIERYTTWLNTAESALGLQPLSRGDGLDVDAFGAATAFQIGGLAGSAVILALVVSLLP
jgi:carboxybiotin decarboxylase